MSIFFGANIPGFDSIVSVPRYDNYSNYLDNGAIYSCQVDGDSWLISQEEQLTEDFHHLKSDEYDFSKQFFVIGEVGQFSESRVSRVKTLKRTHAFTKTFPDFRANFKVRSAEGAVSSYQSEYPFEMLKVRSSIVSNCGVLTGPKGDNFIVLVSIIDEPIYVDIPCKLVDKMSGDTLATFTASTNRVTVFKLDNSHLSLNCYFVAKGYPMIPIYLNSLDGGLSFEHTHPPHDAFFGDFKNLLGDFKNGF